MKIAKLITSNGLQIEKPEAIDGSISWELREAKAYAWCLDGKKCIAELISARIVFVNAHGIRIEGFEPIDLDGLRVRAQSWHCSF
jgi:hypothetical protein